MIFSVNLTWINNILMAIQTLLIFYFIFFVAFCIIAMGFSLDSSVNQNHKHELNWCKTERVSPVLGCLFCGNYSFARKGFLFRLSVKCLKLGIRGFTRFVCVFTLQGTTNYMQSIPDDHYMTRIILGVGINKESSADMSEFLLLKITS